MRLISCRKTRADVRLDRAAVDALAGDGVVDVGDGGEAGELVDRVALEAVRIARAVGALVVVADDGDRQRREVGGAQQLDVGIIRQGAGTQFCTDVVRHFRAVVMPYPVGHEVVLPDGRRGVVSAVDTLDPDRPTVRVAQGRGIEEAKVDMTAPPAVLEATFARRSPLVR